MKHAIRRGGAMAALIVVGALTAGCGGSGTASGAKASAAPSGRVELQAYVACLNQHGVVVTMPSVAPDRTPRPSVQRASGARPSGFPSGIRPSGARGSGGFGGFGGLLQRPANVDETTWTAAQQACASLRPSQGTRNSGAFTAYRNCLSDHGVAASTGAGQLSTSDPKVAAAMKLCEPLRPTGIPRAGGGPGLSPSPTS